MQAVILAAGRGTRLLPITDHLPKPLIPFWGQPFLAYLLESLEGLVDEAIIVEASEGQIADTLAPHYGQLPVRYATQPTPLGTGDALLRTRELLTGPFLLLLGDTCPPRDALHQLVEISADLALTAIQVDDPENHLGISIDADDRIHGIWTDDATVDAGVFRLNTDILDVIEEQPPLRGELRVLQGVARMLEEGADVRAVHMPHPWLQFGDHEELPGVLRVMRQLGQMHGHECGPGASCVMVPADGCEIENSLVFGPGSLKDCAIKDSVVYCATDAVGAAVVGAIETLT